MRYSREQYYRIWLASVEGLGARRINKLLAQCGSAEAVWTDFGESMRWLGDHAWHALSAARSRDGARRLVDNMESAGIAAVFQESAGYPPLLRTLPDAPLLLFVRGNADLSDPLTFAIVGARSCSSAGKRIAQEIAGGLTSAGITVVSGMARGIDSAAHQGAVEAGGRTIAVLGCGVDVVYPPENAELVAHILAMGGSVIAEYAPGTPPLGHHFPVRNRIISGMSRGVLLVEAAVKSGAMITVEHALEQGREVFVVPGAAKSRLSEMPNRLAREGARVITTAGELLEDLGLEAQAWPSRKGDAPDAAFTAEEKRVWDALQDGESSVDALVERTGLSIQEVNSVLTMFGIQGIIEDTL